MHGGGAGHGAAQVGTSCRIAGPARGRLRGLPGVPRRHHRQRRLPLDPGSHFPGTSIGELSWVLNGYNIVFAAFLIVLAGSPTCSAGAAPSSRACSLFTVASALCGAAPSLELLVAARVLQALGAALLVPASLALVVDAFPEDQRAHAIGLWGATAAVAAGLGPPLGGALVELGGWRWAFLVNIPFGLAAVWVARSNLVESRAPGVRRIPDLRGAALLAAGLAALNLGIVKGNDWGWDSANALGSVRRDSRAAGPLRAQLAGAPPAAPRPGAAADPFLRDREPRHRARRPGLLRLPPDQHPLAAVRLEIQRAGGRPRAGARRCGRRHRRRSARAAGEPLRLPPLRRPGSGGLGRRVRLVPPAGRRSSRRSGPSGSRAR